MVARCTVAWDNPTSRNNPRNPVKARDHAHQSELLRRNQPCHDDHRTGAKDEIRALSNDRNQRLHEPFFALECGGGSVFSWSIPDGSRFSGLLSSRRWIDYRSLGYHLHVAVPLTTERAFLIAVIGLLAS